MFSAILVTFITIALAGCVILYTQIALRLELLEEEFDRLKKSLNEAATSVEHKDGSDLFGN